MFYTVVGTYSHVLYGYVVQKAAHDDQELEMKIIFIYKAHSACIRRLVAHNTLLLSGSDDEAIKIYHLDKKRELGTLQQHNGSVSGLEFVPSGGKKTASKWALSSAEDGHIVLWRVHDWAALLDIPAHKPSHTVHYSPLLAPHPSGKLCLSIGSQCELKMWDLTNGKCAFRKKMPVTKRSTPYLFQGQKNEKGRELPVRIQWNPEGTCYAVLYPSHLVIFNVESGEVVCQIEDEQLLMEVAFLSSEYIAIGGEAGTVSVFTTDKGKRVRTLEAHKMRLKGLQTIPYQSIHPEEEDQLPYVITASSDSSIQVWSGAQLCDSSLQKVEPLCSVSTKDRITAFAASYPFALSGVKRARQAEESESSSEEEEEDDEDEDEVDEEQVKKEVKMLKSKRQAKKPRVKISYE